MDNNYEEITWCAEIKVQVDGKDVDFEELSIDAQDFITESISNGEYSGEIYGC